MFEERVLHCWRSFSYFAKFVPGKKMCANISSEKLQLWHLRLLLLRHLLPLQHLHLNQNLVAVAMTTMALRQNVWIRLNMPFLKWYQLT